MLMTISITLYFRNSDHLAHACNSIKEFFSCQIMLIIYLDGVTVCSVMLITTILYMCVIRYVWNHHWIRIILFGTFIIIDISFLAANVMKFFEG